MKKFSLDKLALWWIRRGWLMVWALFMFLIAAQVNQPGLLVENGAVYSLGFGVAGVLYLLLSIRSNWELRVAAMGITFFFMLGRAYALLLYGTGPLHTLVIAAAAWSLLAVASTMLLTITAVKE